MRRGPDALFVLGPLHLIATHVSVSFASTHRGHGPWRHLFFSRITCIWTLHLSRLFCSRRGQKVAFWHPFLSANFCPLLVTLSVSSSLSSHLQLSRSTGINAQMRSDIRSKFLVQVKNQFRKKNILCERKKDYVETHLQVTHLCSAHSTGTGKLD